MEYTFLAEHIDSFDFDITLSAGLISVGWERNSSALVYSFKPLSLGRDIHLEIGGNLSLARTTSATQLPRITKIRFLGKAASTDPEKLLHWDPQAISTNLFWHTPWLAALIFRRPRLRT